jgi:hypothetical protein
LFKNKIKFKKRRRNKMKKFGKSDLIWVLLGFITALVLIAIGVFKSIIYFIGGVTIAVLTLVHVGKLSKVNPVLANSILVIMECVIGLEFVILGVVSKKHWLLIIVGIGSVLLGLLQLGWMAKMGLIKSPRK